MMKNVMYLICKIKTLEVFFIHDAVSYWVNWPTYFKISKADYMLTKQKEGQMGSELRFSSFYCYEKYL